MFKQKQAFTLVELIVVITILAILGTIAFISLQGYSANSRDSVRISDLGNMKTTLELFHLNAGKYATTTEGFTVTYSGSTVWTQGTFGEDTFSNVDRLDKIPVDPLTGQEYTYSITNNKQEYQLAGIMEGDDIALNSALLNDVNAGDLKMTALVIGNYNGKILKTSTGGVNCAILSVPSIISNQPETTTDLVNILTATGLVYNGFNNLPSKYRDSKYNAEGGFDFVSNKLVAYSDSDSCKPLYGEDNAKRIELIENLKIAYSDTVIKDEGGISGIVNVDTGDVNAVQFLAGNLVNNNLGGKVEISTSNIVAERFVASSDKTVVTDNDTGLKWESNKTISGDVTSYGSCHWDMVNYCSSLDIGGISTGWRVPIQSELSYIRNQDNTMDSNYFSYIPFVFNEIYIYDNGDIDNNPQGLEFSFVDLFIGQANACVFSYVRCVHD